MGRYFSGQISGKFWFGIQVSNDAEALRGTKIPKLEWGWKCACGRCANLYRDKADAKGDKPEDFDCGRKGDMKLMKMKSHDETRYVFGLDTQRKFKRYWTT